MKSREFSQVRDGEDPRFDQIQRETSSSKGQIHDILQSLNQFSEQQQHKTEQQKEKGIMTLEMEMEDIQDKKEKWDNNRKAINEIIEQRYGMTLGHEISLGHTQPEFLHKGKAGTPEQALEYWNKISPDERSESTYGEIYNMSEWDGAERLHEIFGETSSPNRYDYRDTKSESSNDNSSDSEEQPKKLTSTEWKDLKQSLRAVKMAYYTLEYLDGNSEKYSGTLLQQARAEREITGTNLRIFVKNQLNTRITNYQKELDRHLDFDSHSDDEPFLSKLAGDNMPSLSEYHVFREKVRTSRILLNNVLRDAPRDAPDE